MKSLTKIVKPFGIIAGSWIALNLMVYPIFYYSQKSFINSFNNVEYAEDCCKEVLSGEYPKDVSASDNLLISFFPLMKKGVKDAARDYLVEKCVDEKER